MTVSNKDYVTRAARYRAAVSAGAVPACRWVRQAVDRQTTDLARQGTPDFEYVFDDAAANRVCAFVELLQHIKGPLAGKRILLEDWQVFILTTVFGWTDNLKHRRFRRVFIEIGKGNGKSLLSSAVALYVLAASGEGGAEILTAASTREQARLVLDVALAMVRGNKKLAAKFGLLPQAHNILRQATNSVMKAVSAQAGGIEGANPSLAVVDEVHAHRDRSVWDALSTSCAKRPTSLFWSISTAGEDEAGICFEADQTAKKILSGDLADESFFGIVFTIDDGDLWFEESSWAKANPNLGVSVDLKELRNSAARARKIPSQQAAFRAKHNNEWLSADQTWVDSGSVSRCIDRALKIEAFAGEACVVGVDAATRFDICARVAIFEKTIEDRRHIYAFGRYLLPSETVENSANSQYKGWLAAGKIEIPPGANHAVDLQALENDVVELNEKHPVAGIAYDNWQAAQMAGNWAKRGLLAVDLAKTAKTYSPVMDWLHGLILDGCFHFGDDPVLKWAFSNVVAHRDKNENLFPNKTKDRDRKIDPLVALLYAAALVKDKPIRQPSVYLTRGVLTL